MYSSSSKMAMGLTLPAAELVAGVLGVRGVLGLGTGIMLAGSCACVVSISGQQSIICVTSVNTGPKMAARLLGSGGGMG